MHICMNVEHLMNIKNEIQLICGIFCLYTFVYIHVVIGGQTVTRVA